MVRPVGSGRAPLAERLLARRIITPDGCWEYDGPRNRKGYGQIGLGGREGAKIGAHRASWMTFRGPIPTGMSVLHHCDNPPCFNPWKCLFLGTAADNTADMVQKGRGRGAPGEANPRARFTEEQVREIRRLYETGEHTTRSLGLRYGVSGVCIFKIVNYRTWRHVA